jgi:hypothetical protein
MYAPVDPCCGLLLQPTACGTPAMWVGRTDTAPSTRHYTVPAAVCERRGCNMGTQALQHTTCTNPACGEVPIVCSPKQEPHKRTPSSHSQGQAAHTAHLCDVLLWHCIASAQCMSRVHQLQHTIPATQGSLRCVHRRQPATEQKVPAAGHSRPSNTAQRRPPCAVAATQPHTGRP